MQQTPFYPIGTPGQPWGDAERAAWRARQVRQRSHADDVVTRVDALRDRFDIETYDTLDYSRREGGGRYPLLAIRSRDWNPDLPVGVITGGVHGYETSGIEGALDFVEHAAAGYAGRINLLVVPCVSPWGYEHIQRWNFDAIDPNRSFRAGSPAQESAALVALLAPLRGTVLVHVDLHETTDTDESEFRPALAARDGVPFEPGGIPDGFYLVDDSVRPQPAFQQAVIAAVEQVTHIAPADADGEMIGSPVVAHGVIEYPVEELGLCAGITGAQYVTTTEVYPDSPRTTPVECNAAQVASIVSALDYALAHR
ncbi:M14 family metallocarboxypeptidase [Luteimonas fraxinea]|uniref:M14 family metallocarboxypeptidase n=1 Tax=Luteimonas fraxinea TaxID=2901869 RepID=A0ABS8UBW9_9GAMM|nr:M14 family metallocarboxypeptidase [Luteimonas fraxinea]MCD9096362.1 M14 family metallocarboxypeptidase [Luteimonas fraxinea]MCD9125705.1 M14 family metallocarboxypeptidase [Luteimonas fraxinea]UHH10264.1 M14 family metallocarboxypeptidase [Luteimonas fraxinea]